MKQFNLWNLLFIFLLVVISMTAVKAQEEMPPPNDAKQNFDKPHRPNLLEELGLTKEQRQQIRRLNAERKPQMRAAQERLHEANRALDQAIYADIINEADVQARLRDVQLAQAEVFKIRALTELAVRRILTPDQLVKFRELRQRFMEKMEDRMNRPPDGPPPGKNPSLQRLRRKN